MPAAAIREAFLVLGTAQLAQPYGAHGKTTPPDPAEAKLLLRKAISSGVRYFDTARAYAGSEASIGRALTGGWASRVEVITKLSPLLDVPPDAPDHAVRSAVDASILESCSALRLEQLPRVLLHRVKHLTLWGGAAWRRLLELRDAGLIGMLGASAQDPSEANAALACADIKHIQIPFNLLDFRWEQAGIPARLLDRPDVMVHARSVLLQGVLIARDPSAWPRLPGLDAEACIRWLENAAVQHGRSSVADLCISYARSQPWIHGLVIGMESLAQLEANKKLFASPVVTSESLSTMLQHRPLFPQELLNPSLWPTSSMA